MNDVRRFLVVIALEYSCVECACYGLILDFGYTLCCCFTTFNIASEIWLECRRKHSNVTHDCINELSRIIIV